MVVTYQSKILKKKSCLNPYNYKRQVQFKYVFLTVKGLGVDHRVTYDKPAKKCRIDWTQVVPIKK